jgi:N-acetylglucosamine-6-sulfatase
MDTSQRCLTRKAVEFLKETDRDTPFFLYLSHKAVHGPFTPEPQYKGTLSDQPFTLPLSSERLINNQLNRPRWLLDQRNSWHGMDFPLHTVNSVNHFIKVIVKHSVLWTTVLVPLCSS